MLISDVRAFHEKMNLFPFDKGESDRVEIDDKRMRLIDEEGAELKEAIEEGDKAHILQEAIDVIYVAVGACHEAGIKPEQLRMGWDLVHQANMLKTPPESAGEKPSKPEGWKKPDMNLAMKVCDPFHTELVTYTAGHPGTPAATFNIEANIFCRPGKFTREGMESLLTALHQKHRGQVVTIMNVISFHELPDDDD